MTRRRFLAALVAGAAALLVSACVRHRDTRVALTHPAADIAPAGPSRERYAELLGECRVANREHLRMLKAYETMACRAHPEQANGAAEMGLGGF